MEDLGELGELAAFAKANPGKLSYDTPGANTSLHVTMEEIAHRNEDGDWRLSATASPPLVVPAKAETQSLTGVVPATAGTR